MAFVLLIDIYDMYTYIYLYRYVYASQSGRLFLYSAWQNVFMHFLNGNWSNSSARLHDGTMARGGACVERLMRFHARQKAHEIVKNYFLSYSGNIFHSANKLNSTLVRELTNSVHLFSAILVGAQRETRQFELSVANRCRSNTQIYGILARTLLCLLSLSIWFELSWVRSLWVELSWAFWLPLDPLLLIYWCRWSSYGIFLFSLSLFLALFLFHSFSFLWALGTSVWRRCKTWADIAVYAVNIVKCLPVCVKA